MFPYQLTIPVEMVLFDITQKYKLGKRLYHEVNFGWMVFSIDQMLCF